MKKNNIDKLYKLQNDLKNGKVKHEELTYDQIILLNRLYDIQIQKLELENNEKLRKILKYRKRGKN